MSARKEAIKWSSNTYKGKPCKNGHTIRYTSNRACVACTLNHNKVYRTPEYQRNKGEVLSKKERGKECRLYKDDRTHAQYRAYVQMRNFRLYRKEEWDYSFEDWSEDWNEYWEQKGRHREGYMMTRIDCTKPWGRTNIVIKQRKEGYNNGN